MEIGDKDLDCLDPDWRFAYFHAKSTKPGHCSQQNPELCECCLNIIHKQPIPLCVHAKQLQFLGFGIPLWYNFLKLCCILILMLIVSDTAVSVYEAIQINKNFCLQEYKEIHLDFSPTQEISHPAHSPHHSQSFIRNHKNEQKISEHPHATPSDHRNDTSLLITKPVEEGQHGGKNEQKISEHPHSSPSDHRNDTGLLIAKPREEGQHGGKQGEHAQGHHHLHCTGIFILLSRIDANIDDLQNVLRVTTFIVTLLTLIFIRDSIYKTEQYYDQRRCSLSDFSVMLCNLPQSKGIQNKIRRFFDQGFSQSIHIQEIILIPELQELEEIQQQKSHELIHLKKYYEQGKQMHRYQVQQIERKLEQFQKRQNHEVEQFRHLLDHDELISQKAIIVLSTQPIKLNVLQQFQNFQPEHLANYFGEQGVEIELEQAPEPKQIIWEEINYPSSKRIGRIILGWGLSVLFIAAITVVFYFILKWKTSVVEQKQSLTEATVIVFIALLSVIFFNKFVMGTVLHHFTHLEKHATSDLEQFSFAFKYALGMFFTTALMTLFVEAITYNNFYKHHFGVIQQQSIMFFLNSLLVPIIWLINPFQIMVLIKRKLSFGKKHLTQREANHLMEDFNYDVGKRYAQVLQSIWFTFLYVSLIPMGSFLTLIGIGCYYWVDKYNLLRRSSMHQNVSGKLSIRALKLLDLVLIFLPLGQMIFDHFLRNQVEWSTIVCFIIAIIYLLLPVNQILDLVNKQNFNLQEKSYSSVKHTFREDYYKLHPMYSKSHSDKNSESRKLYKQHVLSRFANPIFSFAAGWLSKNKSKKDLGQTSPTSPNSYPNGWEKSGQQRNSQSPMKLLHQTVINKEIY